MNDDSKQSSHQFDASLPLPIEEDDSKPEIIPPQQESPAAELIRKKVAAIYDSEPAAAAEIKELDELKSDKLSKHQRFIYELTNSGKSLHDIQVAWHEYYDGLSDAEKHEVWQEFYNVHSRASRYKSAAPRTETAQPVETMEARAITANQQHTLQTYHQPYRLGTEPLSRTMAELRGYFGAVGQSKAKSHLQSLAFGLGVGSIVLIIFLFSFFNERIIAPFIQPSRNVTNTPVITGGTAIGPNPEIIIPKINVEIPVVYNVNTIDEAAVENALNDGVVHYADTALPGQDGNGVIVGHSSNNIFNPGKYKFAFVLLSRLDNGDTFYLQKDGKRYTYQVYEKEIVNPTDVSVLGNTDKPATMSLITCDPPGTSINRLVVVGEQIDPSPDTNLAKSTQNSLATSAPIIPGNSPTLWSRLVHWFEQ